MPKVQLHKVLLFIPRNIEHQHDSYNQKCESPGATEHCLEGYCKFNRINTKTLSTEQQLHNAKNRRVVRNKKKSKNEQKKKSFELL